MVAGVRSVVTDGGTHGNGSDVTIIGAGPAGLRLAERLAARSVSVTVYERRSSVGWQTCSGLLSAETVERFHLQPAAKWRIDGAVIHVGSSPLSEHISVRRRGVAYVFDRRSLDRLLLGRARAAGASVVFNAAIDAESLHHLQERAEYIIGAAGVGDPLRLRLHRPSRVLSGAIALVPSDIAAERSVHIFIDERAPLFFSWAIPRGDMLELGTAVAPERVGEVPGILRSVAGDLGIAVSPSFEIKYRPIVVDAPLRRVVFERFALVGDAASQVKATTGGGISFGLRAADLLADALVAGDLSLYQHAYLRSVYPELLAHYFVRRVMDRIGPEGLLRSVQGLADILGDALSGFGQMDSALSLFSSGLLPVTSRIASRVLRTLLGLP